MALKDTVSTLKKLIENINRDLDKAIAGNKAASQRVRTGSIKFEKTAKTYRKESIAVEKKSGSKRAGAKAKKLKVPSSAGRKTTYRYAAKRK